MTAARGPRAGHGLRRGAVGLVAAVSGYAVLRRTAGRQGALPGAGWASSAAERLHPYSSALAESRTVQEAAQVLSWVHTWTQWPLMAMVLLWLAHRDQAVYVRTAIALLLSNAAGFGVFAALHGWPVRETSFLHGYLSLPGVPEGWYLLLALAVLTTTARLRTRTVARLAALSAVVAAELTTDRHLLAALPAAVVPWVVWYATGRLLRRSAESGTRTRRARPALPAARIRARGRARGVVVPSPEERPEGGVARLPLRARMPEAEDDRDSGALRKAG